MLQSGSLTANHQNSMYIFLSHLSQ